MSERCTHLVMLPSTERNRDRQGATATYLITWVCYGAWLPGRAGAVPRELNRFGGPLPEPDPNRERQAGDRMTQPPYQMDALRREIALSSLQEACFYRGWTLLAAHVRTNHIHVVIRANCRPDAVMTILKAYASRALNVHQLDSPDRRRWAHHGSTRYLWTIDSVLAAIRYVVHEQGESMAVLEARCPR